MKKGNILIIMFVIFSNLVFAAETDAEILKDLDFYSDLDVFREGVVFEDGGLDDNPSTTPAPALDKTNVPVVPTSATKGETE